MLKTDRSKHLYERACRSLATGVSTVFRRNVTPIPLYMKRASGPYHYDADGHELLDYLLAWGPLIVGNNHPKLTEAVMQQLATGYTYGAQHEDEIRLSELMVKTLPGVERVIYSNTGTEAVQAALRLARAYTGRDKIIKFEGHYHGWLNNVLVSVHPSAEQLGQTVPSCGGQPAEEYSHTIALPWNDLAALEQTLEKHRDQIACVITEPVLVNGGCCMPEEGYLRAIIDLCKQHGAVSIFDEVITGFRLALGGAREYFGLEPDLSIYAKAIAGGFSFSAIGGGQPIFDVLEDGRTIHAGTYNGNPIGVAAAIATIGILSEPGTFDRMHRHGNAIRETIEKASAACGQKLVTTGTGAAFSVHFDLERPPHSYRDVMKANTDKYTCFRAHLLEHHIQLAPDGRWYIGATHTDNELEKVIPAIQQSMKALVT